MRAVRAKQAGRGAERAELNLEMQRSPAWLDRLVHLLGISKSSVTFLLRKLVD